MLYWWKSEFNNRSYAHAEHGRFEVCLLRRDTVYHNGYPVDEDVVCVAYTDYDCVKVDANFREDIDLETVKDFADEYGLELMYGKENE